MSRTIGLTFPKDVKDPKKPKEPNEPAAVKEPATDDTGKKPEK